VNISVIILNWNRPGDTVKAVESALGQDYPDFEALVWDNASSDSSAALLRERFGGHPRFRLLTADRNYGVAGGRNRAFAAAAGDLLVTLDSDAVFESPDALGRVAGHFEADPQLGALAFDIRRPDQSVYWPFARPLDRWREAPFETFRVDGCSFAVRRSLLDPAGAFPEYFSPFGAEDRYLGFRVIGAGYRIVYDPRIRVRHDASPRGRWGLQFVMHVRNSLWIPLEVFPMPQALLSLGALAARLFRDARGQRQVGGYLRGVAQALAGFRPSRRRPMPRARWRYIRRLVEEDKNLGTIG
jgi:GT2 family glycosyltransferase